MDMKKTLIALFAALMLPVATFADKYTGLWKEYDEAVKKDLPKSQINVLERIAASAAKEKSYGNLLKAEVRRINTLASISALGATNDFTVGVYKVDEKKYYANSFQGSFEIVSLTGTINTMNGEFYTHIHMSAGNDQGQVFGGHLNKAVVSATCEMVITLIDGHVDRVYDEETGLNIFRF